MFLRIEVSEMYKLNSFNIIYIIIIYNKIKYSNIYNKIYIIKYNNIKPNFIY